jgi:cell filamentation protein
VRYENWTDYFYPGTRTLRNRFAERDPEVLSQLEVAVARVRMRWLRDHPLPGPFDMKRLCATHKHIFQDVYEWAGKPRTAPWLDRMTKGYADVVNFEVGDPAAPKAVYAYAPASIIESASQDLFAHLADENELVGLDHDTFIARLAYYWAEINTVHAFREGNTRTQSMFFGQLAQRAGHPLNVALFAEDARLRDAFVAARFYAQATTDESRLAAVLSQAYERQAA